MLLFQVFVNVGMVIGIMPVTGIPLPFISNGGASLVTIAIGLGILQSINIRQGKAEW
jgi:rod shape determining protein RodA